MQLSGYRSMWVVTMFDLPVDTPSARRDSAQFRQLLLKNGFTMLQFSVYGRHSVSEEQAHVHTSRIEHELPPDGEVRVLMVTERQFEKMRIFWGKIRKPCPASPEQLTLF